MSPVNPYHHLLNQTRKEVTSLLYLEFLGNGFVEGSEDFDQTLLTFLVSPINTPEHEYFFQTLYKVTLDRVSSILGEGERLDVQRFQDVFYREYLQGKFSSESFFEKVS